MRCHPRPSESCDFNSHPHKETNISHRLIHCVSYISIHVSLRRRTIWPLPHHSMVPFHFTSPFGDELLSSLACAKTLQFQLTSPRGNERSLRTAYGQGIRPFQFTSPQGDEQEVKPSVDFGWIFQLTSPQGDELKELMKYTANTYISTHVSVRRRTSYGIKAQGSAQTF